MMRPSAFLPGHRHGHGDDGQVVVVFAAALVVLIGMVGLVLDGGSTFAQRRVQQGIADLASMAGATAYLNTTGDVATRSAAAEAAVRTVAGANGLPLDDPDIEVDVAVIPTLYAANVRVAITRPHRNAFVGLLGMPTWEVGVDATSVSSNRPNGARGAMPLLFNAEAFPNAVCDESSGRCVAEVYQEPGVGNEDVPQDATQFNWTVFCQASGNACNANSSDVRDIVDGAGTNGTIHLGMDIGPLNAGSHTTLFQALGAYVGGTFPVPIVDDQGHMVGFAYFRLTAIEGTSQKVIRGYFVSPINADGLAVVPNVPEASLDTGSFVIKLID